MRVVPLERHWNGYLDESLIEKLDSSLFLSRCRAGTVTKAELDEFVVQQYFYSRHFTRYLCALLSNISREKDRLELMENLLEEIGFDEEGAKPHSVIYREMMAKMEIDPERETIHPSTQALVDTMFECCRNTNPMMGLGALCLGAEAIVPHVYSQLVMGFEAVGEPEEHLEFFRLHIEEDDAHAVTMLQIIKRELLNNPMQKIVLRNAAHRLVEARTDFFNSIAPDTSRRAPQVPGAVFYEQILL